MPTVNPVLAGCYPDPSVCRVDDTFYLVNSSFSYYPGLPIHRSTDLENWELVGHALERDSWVEVGDGPVSDGVWAPTIRHSDGVFYIVFPLARGKSGSGFYVTTATSASGPWRIPVRLEGSGIDPSLFFDDDGRCWFTAVRDTESATATGPGEVWMREFDTESLMLIGHTHVLWHGALTGAWIEAPHLYKRAGRYVLIGAEGGTESNHAVTAATSNSVTGPYRTDPRSPLLTHRHLGAASRIQNVGHADLVDGADGRSWATVLATRPIDGHHTLGRETFLVPVEWEPAGPVFAPGSGRIDEMDLSFARATDDRDWVSLRGPAKVNRDEQTIHLTPSPHDLTDNRTPAFLAVRQTSHFASFEATLDPTELGQTEAGLVAFQNAQHHLRASLKTESDGSRLQVAQIAEGTAITVASRKVVGDTIRLRIRAASTLYSIEVDSGTGPEVLSQIPHTALSTETAGGFVGVLLGVFAVGPSDNTPVRFDGVHYANEIPLDLQATTV